MYAIRRLLTPVFAATLALAAACSEQKPQATAFTPVPVTPVLGDVPMGDANAPVTLIEYAALSCHVCRDFAKQVFPRLKSTIRVFAGCSVNPSRFITSPIRRSASLADDSERQIATKSAAYRTSTPRCLQRAPQIRSNLFR